MNSEEISIECGEKQLNTVCFRSDIKGTARRRTVFGIDRVFNYALRQLFSFLISPRGQL